MSLLKMRGMAPMPSRISVLTITSCLLVAVSLIGPSNPALAGPADHAIALLNDTRSAAGVATLAHDPQLERVAFSWAETMAGGQFLAHNRALPDSIDYGWWMWGENVGRGVSTGAIHRAWVDSETHRRNLLETRFTHAGIGAAYAADGRIYLVQVFGAW